MCRCHLPLGDFERCDGHQWWIGLSFGGSLLSGCDLVAVIGNYPAQEIDLALRYITGYSREEFLELAYGTREEV